MSFFDVLFGKPLASNEAHAEHIGVAAGIPIFGLDGLTSAAYGPEAAMTLLIPLGLWGVQHYLLPIFGFILTLLTILYFSYRQTIEAYPNGGGSFTVASENLGEGRAAGGGGADDRLHSDGGGRDFRRRYGAGERVSAYEVWAAAASATSWMFCLILLVLIAIINMRGVKETGAVFMLPTFLFVRHAAADHRIGVGVSRILTAVGGHPAGDLAPPPPTGGRAGEQVLRRWLMAVAADEGVLERMRGDDRRGGCVERRDGVQGAAQSKNANHTLTVIIFDPDPVCCLGCPMWRVRMA